ncbi:MAG TPA: regulatory protein RecX [Thermoanaerobaculia bacterium]|nr:regulatory protein RecX [Thermoanaerobaculia bacterium]
MKTAYEKALELLARRAHLRAQLAEKLRQRGYEGEEIAAVLGRLEREGYLDDVRAARDFAAGKRDRQGWGRRRVALELRRRGAPSEAVAAALEELPVEEELARARRAASRYRGGGAALARHLSRKGFAPHVIFVVLQEVEEAPPAGSP